MRHTKIFPLVICLFIVAKTIAQNPAIKVLESGKKISLRGLSVVNDQVIWASGSAGSVARSTDGGQTFSWQHVAGYEKNDFRDIEAFDENTAIIMGITQPAVMLKTIDGGKSWKKVFEDTTKGAFWDAIDFTDAKNGVLIGDPIDQTFYMAFTHDQGDTWVTANKSGSFNTPSARNGEAFFASSGTNIKMTGSYPVYVSGGKSSRLFYRPGDSIMIPIIQGKESTGANSIALFKSHGVIVGGDFAKDTISLKNAVLFTLKNKIKFSLPSTPPHGYRSCVIYLNEKNLLTCGTSGIDISKDGGMNWQLISKESFHVCRKAKNGNAVFLAGSNGRIAKLMHP